MITFEARPVQITPFDPIAASTEPTTPPTSACDDDEGMPRYHVVTFHRIAPTSPAKTICTVTSPSWTIPLAMVAATATEMNAPTKLRIAARPTATRGGSARVAIVVAMALAVSWKPFVKSKTIAAPTASTTNQRLGMTRAFQEHDGPYGVAAG